MPTLDNLAARFAHCVSLFRDPSAKTEQKKEFRTLLGLLQETAVTLRLGPGGSSIELNGVPCEGAGRAVLMERLDLHGIGEIALPANPPPAQLFELLQALADQPGAHDVASRLAADRAAPRRESGADELLSLSSERPTAPEPPGAAPARPPSPPPAPSPAAPDPPPGAKRAAARAPAARATPTAPVALPPGAGEVLADLERNSTAPNVGDLLAALIDHAAGAAKLGRFEQVLGVIAGVIRVEEKVPEASGVRRQYGIALRRFYTKPVLEGLSRLLAAPKHRAAAVAALQRGGAAGVEGLMDVLAAAPTGGERRAGFGAFKHMTEGTERLVHMLGHSRWVRGEDEAVVRELILALGRTGSPDAVQALIKWAQPTGRFFGRKPSELRVAAVEALRLAATPAALGTLEGLSDDGDREVREAASRGVAELKRKTRR